jgi:hypothetical protein
MGLGKNIPMSLIDILTNAAGGGVVGTALHLATDWVDTRNKIALMKAQSLLIEQSEAWKAFGAAQQTASPYLRGMPKGRDPSLADMGPDGRTRLCLQHGNS